MSIVTAEIPEIPEGVTLFTALPSYKDEWDNGKIIFVVELLGNDPRAFQHTMPDEIQMASARIDLVWATMAYLARSAYEYYNRKIPKLFDLEMDLMSYSMEQDKQ